MKDIVVSVLLIILSFLTALVFLKAISGEDCWIPNGKGGWVKHGSPAGPALDRLSTDADYPNIVTGLILLLISGSLLSCLSLYLYHRFFKVRMVKGV